MTVARPTTAPKISDATDEAVNAYATANPSVPAAPPM
jgi:hypothetical protein